jgi:hypothetical protein
MYEFLYLASKQIFLVLEYSFAAAFWFFVVCEVADEVADGGFGPLLLIPLVVTDKSTG